jgi:hypothetical protein
LADPKHIKATHRTCLFLGSFYLWLFSLTHRTWMDLRFRNHIKSNEHCACGHCACGHCACGYGGHCVDYDLWLLWSLWPCDHCGCHCGHCAHCGHLWSLWSLW